MLLCNLLMTERYDKQSCWRKTTFGPGLWVYANETRRCLLSWNQIPVNLRKQKKNLAQLQAEREEIKSSLESKEKKKLDCIRSKILLHQQNPEVHLGFFFFLSRLFNHLDKDIGPDRGKRACSWKFLCYNDPCKGRGGVSIRQTQEPKRKWRHKMKKLLGLVFLVAAALVCISLICWTAKFGCQPLVTHSGRIVPLISC